MSKMKIEFGFGVGYRGDGSALLEHEQVAGVREIRNRASQLFGGHTLVNTLGEWFDAEADFMVAEPGCTLFVLTDSGESGVDARVVELAEQIRNSLSQKAVCVTFSEVKFLILN